MPSALETLVKILKLEREQGYKNKAVQGGLSAYAAAWSESAHGQARKPEHHSLVDEITERLRRYDELSNANERHSTITYVLERITGRRPPPEGSQPARQPDGANDSARQEPAQRPERREARREKAARREQAPQQPPGSKDSPERRKSRKDGAKQKPPQEQRRQNRTQQRGSDDAGFSRLGDDSSRLDYDYIGEARTPGKRDLPTRPRLARPPRRPRPALDTAEALERLHGLNASVDKLKGIGTTTTAKLEKLGIRSIQDLLTYLPRRYDDYTALLVISRLKPNMQVTILAGVRSTQISVAQGGRKNFQMTVDDGTGMMQVTFFGQPWLHASIRPNMQIVLRGVTSIFRNQLQFINPEWEEVDTEDLQRGRIVPVYGLTEGLKSKTLRKTIEQALDQWAEHIPDFIPEATLERCELADLGWTLRQIHNPEGWDHLHHAKRRFVFDQLLLLQLAVLGNRRAWQSIPSDVLDIAEDWLDTFLQTVFPYPLTGAQRRAIEDIRADIRKPIPMNRLLQGDVGSGKTAVAVAALAMAFSSGRQAVLMAPTGILAEQHFRSISALMAQMPGERKPSVVLLTSAISSAEREQAYAGIRDGSIDIIIGTHAVIQEGIEYSDLALAIIDEQHRFGVEQRGALRSKGRNPHLLVMTATPIPRTLALTIHADLDLSVLDEMPPGRIPVRTKVIEPTAREKAYELIEDQLARGRQAFIVYPLVDASESIDAQAATEAFAELQKVFYRYKVGLLHGKMKPADKDSIMADFSQHKFDVMVTTSVAEVGVDIPNASIIMIEGANRFGLAQLHQFRGRVGRGGHASYCLLVCDSEVQEARERLSALEQFSDGFKLAEIDWKLRGAGDLVGTRQSGQSTLRLLEDMSPELVELAQREARTIFEEDPDLTQEQHHLIAQRVGVLSDERADIS
jgi:ATP-dependent DNA helicase RecG